MIDPTAFVGSSVAMVVVRPTAIAHVVKANDRAGLERAVAYACTEWGGAGQPILPLVRGLTTYPRWNQVRDIVAPEAVIEFAGLSREQADDLGRAWQVPVVLEGHLTLPYQEPGAHAGLVLDPARLRSRTLFLPRRRASLAERVVLGHLAPEQADFWRSLGMPVEERESDLELLEAQIDKLSPVSLTRQVFGAYETESFMAPVLLDVSTRPTITGLIWFWNARALAIANGLHVIWLPPAALRDPTVVGRLRQLILERRIQAQPDLVIHGDRGQDLDEIALSIGLAPLPDGPTRTRLMEDAPRDLTARPLTYAKRLDPAQWLFGRRLVGTVSHVPTTITRPATTMTIESPVRFFNSNGPLKVSVKDPNFDWPRTTSTARLLHDDAAWTAHGLTLGFPASGRFQFSLRVPEPQRVAEAMLGERGFSWRLSDKGRYAEALVASIPGTEAPVATELELRVLRALTSLSRRKAEQAMRAALGDVTDADAGAIAAEVLPMLLPRWRTAQQVGQDLGLPAAQIIPVLNALIDRHIVRRSFRFRCPTCGVEDSISIERARDQVRCEGCRVVSTIRGAGDSEPVLQYGLSSLADRVMDQDCLGHILVQRWMAREQSALWAVPGAELRHEELTREVDVLAVSRKTLLVSEVKNSTGGFTADQIERSVYIASEIGAGVLVLATLDAFDDAVRQECQRSTRTFKGSVHLLGLRDLLGAG